MWIGGIANKHTARRFVRISPDLKQEPFIIEGGLTLDLGEDIPESSHRMPKRGEYVTILDSALVECGLAKYWLAEQIDSEKTYWVESTGRRPQIHHEQKLNLADDSEKTLVQASGRIVEIFHQQLTPETVDDFVEQAIANDIRKITIRTPLEPSLHPKIQGSFDRQLARRSGKRDGFIIQHPNSEMSMLCVLE